MTEAEWLASVNPQLMLESLWGDQGDRKLRLFACACVRRAWHHLNSHQSREATEVVERHADGRAAPGELEEARDRAWAVSGEFDRASDEMEGVPDGRFQAESLAAGAVANACCYGGEPTYLVRVASAAHDAAQAAWSGRPPDAPAARDAEWLAQAGLLRCIYGNRFRPAAVTARWLSPVARQVARAAYDERHLPSGEMDPHRLAVLADALEEAGAPSELVAHLRTPGPHVRGCHAVDLCLGLN